MTKKIIGVIPARYKSSRFPGKPLALLLGKPMILWVAELTGKALGNNNTYVATEDTRISDLVEKNGFNAILTSDEHLTGTDRLAEVAKKVKADIYLNIQGDEPIINSDSIQKVMAAKLQYPNEVINAMAILGDNEDPANVNIPKVTFNSNYKMIYMSRLPIPGFKSTDNKPEKYFKQVCIYAFTKNELLRYGSMKQKGLVEQHEDIEILRCFELDIPVRMVEVEGNTLAVDVIEDISPVEKRLKEIHGL